MRARRPLLSRVLAGMLAMLAVGCATAPPEPESMRAPDVDFSAFRTFGWAASESAAGTEPPLQLLDQNLRRSISEELARRGYVPAGGATPDLLIAYRTASKEQVESSPVRIGIGVGSWGGNGGGSVGLSSSSLRNYREGTLVIHAIDAARNAEVWQGRISGKLTEGSLEPAAIKQAVATAMRDFPSRQ
jgi:Domain of unknown function (DUF4136)